MARARLFTIAPGVPFLATFVRALLAGEIVSGVSRASGPLSLADVTIYVPTQRATRALVAEFARQSGSAATFLPKIRPLGAVDEDAANAAEPDVFQSFDPGAPPAISDIERRFLLANLVRAWSSALRGAIVGRSADGRIVTDPSQALVVGATPADALALADELGSLIDEFIVEGADWSSVRHLAAEDYDRYWGISADFLKIAFAHWPDLLAERGVIDLVARRAKLIGQEIVRLANVDEPTIVLGSTGTNRATADLMRAIARMPRGAVVLPGLDQIMPDKDWRFILGRKDEIEPAWSHPQAALARLLQRLGVERNDVRALGRPHGALEKRGRFVSRTLAPGQATSDWRAYVAACGDERAEALADVALIEAADEREEALAIAIRLRCALETPHATAALITPDRAIARRVRAELVRWDIHVDDSGGEPLGATGAGAFSRAALRAACENSDVAFLALLGSDRVAPTQERACTQRLAQLVEIAVLRATPHNDDFSARFAIARENARDRHAHPATQRIEDCDWREMKHLALAADAALAPLRAQGEKRGVGAWIALHTACLEALAKHAAPQEGEDAAALRDLFDEVGALGEDAAQGVKFDLDDYRALFDRLLSSQIVRGPHRAHARLKILGALEARLLDADLVVLAGLDETIWPPQPKSDAFLNRPMRAQLGLSPPERRIGQSAHDYANAMGAKNVVLTRALKRARAPTVASRFLQRLGALAGETELAALRARGAHWLGLARLIDHAPTLAPLARPAPKPPLDMRPDRLSVTRIEALRRDPYAIYAERILKLHPLPPLDFAIGAAEQGTGVHAALAELAGRWPSGPLPQEARDFLVNAAREELGAFFADPAWRAFRWPALEAGLDYVIAYEAERRAHLARIVAETRGTLAIDLDDGAVFHLSAAADRIEIDAAGRATIVDYKTGRPPTAKQVRIGLAPQLTLEAAMARRGAFASIGAVAPECGLYIRVGGKDGGEIAPVSAPGQEFVDLADEHFAELKKLLSAYRNFEQGYASRALAQFIVYEGAYDHLARVKEWSASGGESEGEP
ncbi:MAG: double-strand break repair protein AddB [Rhodoblastus sp.]